MTQPPSSYAAAGVDINAAGNALAGLIGWLNKTLDFPSPTGKPAIENGFFATVHDLGGDLGVAVGTDGVGTKLLVAEALGKYDTVGIDLIAMNANDILCVGARPFALVDYLAVQDIRAEMLEALGRGLYEGARQAGVAIAGGELAQVPDLIRGLKEGEGFDIAATCLGVVQISKIIDGRDIRDGDLVVGYRSSGLHSNGYTLARRVLLSGEAHGLADLVPELGCTLGEELLRPTHIYVKPVLAAIEQTGGVTGLAHITGGGFTNLLRLRTTCGFLLDNLPPAPPIFGLIQRQGNVPITELYEVFNMGVGFCAVVRPSAAERTVAIAAEHGYQAQVVGSMRADLAGQVVLPGVGLVGGRHGFRPA
jgi:phosphoribosylformylglycinamidine cyclo-ligase